MPLYMCVDVCVCKGESEEYISVEAHMPTVKEMVPVTYLPFDVKVI